MITIKMENCPLLTMAFLTRGPRDLKHFKSQDKPSKFHIVTKTVDKIERIYRKQ